MARSTAADPNAPDRGVGYHLEQTVEKLLKALLEEKNLDYPKTHSLDRLMDLVTRHMATSCPNMPGNSVFLPATP